MRPKTATPKNRTTAMIWPETIPMIDAITLRESAKVGRAVNRSHVINEMIAREYKHMNKEQPND